MMIKTIILFDHNSVTANSVNFVIVKQNHTGIAQGEDWIPFVEPVSTEEINLKRSNKSLDKLERLLVRSGNDDAKIRLFQWIYDTWSSPVETLSERGIFR